jgi:hypothetical protein
MGEATAHRWWYRCSAKAGVVEQGVTSSKKDAQGAPTWHVSEFWRLRET